MAPNYKPKLAVIIVTKRINERFFMDHSSLANPNPGTIVGNNITDKNGFDFYLAA